MATRAEHRLDVRRALIEEQRKGGIRGGRLAQDLQAAADALIGAFATEVLQIHGDLGAGHVNAWRRPFGLACPEMWGQHVGS